jgi:hypothetical protein
LFAIQVEAADQQMPLAWVSHGEKGTKKRKDTDN